ncbi:Tubulin-specific chaperone D [Porphyridium purpureum]|uniref:Tubulin-specific chaperone D n=1 Tax=Porphyridium purpureum TaxID=35688 RepID=A0A5J4Z1M1_PORPP|nr:Tubulin-specific chaperone D [Porphyridium purpureum]|eukprot:POR8424..scf208_2
MAAARNNAEWISALARRLVLPESPGSTDSSDIKDAARLAVSNAKLCDEIIAYAQLFREHPVALDRELVETVSRVANAARAWATVSCQHRGDDTLSETAVTAIGPYMEVIYELAQLRGRKVVANLMPHAVSDLKFAARALLGMTDPTAGMLDGGWKWIYGLCVWMCTLSLIPFPLDTIIEPRIVSHLLETGVALLVHPGAVRTVAAAMLARVLVRPDRRNDLHVFVRRVAVSLSSDESTAEDRVVERRYERYGMIQTLTEICKVGRRHDIDAVFSQHFSMLIASLTSIVDQDARSVSSLDHHLIVKLVSRMAALLFPEVPLRWKYVRSYDSLFGRKQGTRGLAPTARDQLVSREESIITLRAIDQMEHVLNVVLLELEHPDTIVRWSAAKAVGRLTERLPFELAMDVVEAVLALFYDNKSGDSDDISLRTYADAAWHGACLALAELFSRGLILPADVGADGKSKIFMDKAVRIILAALKFDVRRGAHSVGANIRDAACYCCWSLARAYNAKDLVRLSESGLAEALLTVALFDREVNCRRAASAAFQEGVGRFGVDFCKAGVDIVATADYFSLGDRNLCYVELAPKIARLGGESVLNTLWSELVSTKFAHWDVSVRQSAASSIGRLAEIMFESPVTERDFRAEWMRIQNTAMVSPETASRHGATLALAALLRASTCALRTQSIAVVREVLESLGWLKPKQGSISLARPSWSLSMKKLSSSQLLLLTAACELVNACFADLVILSARSDEEVRHEPADINYTLRFLVQCAKLSRASTSLQTSVAAAVQVTTHVCLQDPDTCTLLKQVLLGKDEDATDTVADQHAFLLIVGNLPSGSVPSVWAIPPTAPNEASLFSACFEKVLTFFCDGVDIGMACNACIALASLFEAGCKEKRLCKTQAESALKRLGWGLNNYFTDERGDVGSLLRRECVHVFGRILSYLTGYLLDRTEGFVELLRRVVDMLVWQLCERMDAVRREALETFLIGRDDLARLHLFEAGDLAALQDVCVRVRNLGYMDMKTDMFIVLASLLRKSCFRNSVMLGLVSCMVSSHGIINVSLLQSRPAFSRIVEDSSLECLVALVEEHTCGDRLLLPCLIVLERALLFRAVYRSHSEPGNQRLEHQLHLAFRIVTLYRKHAQSCRDLHRLQSIGRALLECAELAMRSTFETKNAEDTSVTWHTVRLKAFEGLMLLLCHAMPLVRVFTADILYLHVLANVHTDSDGSAEHNAQRSLLGLLGRTGWDRASIEELRANRNQICSFLGIIPPRKRGVTTGVQN